MAYLKPQPFVSKVLNKIAMATGLMGTETLTVVGRKSGKPQAIPVIPVEFDGARYLVSTRGDSQWVLNIRVNPQVRIARKRKTSTYAAAEVPTEARAAILQAYREKAGREVEQYFRKLPDPADHPVFRLNIQG